MFKKIVYVIILGSGAGGGLVIDKKIVTGPNGVAGEWGHNQIPYFAAKKENLETSNLRDAEIESVPGNPTCSGEKPKA